MATKNVPAKSKSTAVTNWEERLAARAKASVEQANDLAGGQFIQTRAGQLSYQDNPFKDNQIHAVVADWVYENAYYDKPFDPDNPATPVCYSFGRKLKEMVPHPESPKKQHGDCHTCPMNQFGSAPNDRNGKACKNQIRMALLPASPLSQEGLKKMDVAYLKVPVTSTKAWGSYVKLLANLRKRDPIGVVTVITTKPDPKSQFKMIFDHGTDLNNDCLAAVFEREKEIMDSIIFPYPDQPESVAKPKAKPAGQKKATRKY